MFVAILDVPTHYNDLVGRGGGACTVALYSCMYAILMSSAFTPTFTNAHALCTGIQGEASAGYSTLYVHNITVHGGLCVIYE